MLQTDVPINGLGKIRFNQTSEGYQFDYNDRILRNINKETIEIAEGLIKKNAAKGDNRLLGMDTRTIEKQMLEYNKGVNLSRKITSEDLRKYGKITASADIIEWLQE